MQLHLSFRCPLIYEAPCSHQGSSRTGVLLRDFKTASNFWVIWRGFISAVIFISSINYLENVRLMGLVSSKTKLRKSKLRSRMKTGYDSMWFGVFANVMSVILNDKLGFMRRQNNHWFLKQHREWTKTINLCLMLMCLMQYITELVLC